MEFLTNRELPNILITSIPGLSILGSCSIIATTAYCLVAIIEHDFKLNRSTFDVLCIFSMSLLDKTPIRELFKKIEKLDEMSENDQSQLCLNF